MKLPRDLDGVTLTKALSGLGDEVTWQTGSHMRLTQPGPPPHHVTIPAHTPLKLGTLAGILADVAQHQGLSRDQLQHRLF